MNRISHKIVTCISILLYSGMLRAEYTVADLETHYQRTVTTIKELQGSVHGFPQEYQGTLPQSIDNTLSAIATFYNEAQTKIQNRTAGKTELSPLDKALVSKEVDTAIKNFLQKEVILKSLIDPVQKQVDAYFKTDENARRLNEELQIIINDFIAYGASIQADFQTTKTTDTERIRVVRELITTLSQYDVAPISVSIDAIASLLETTAGSITTILEQATTALHTAQQKALSTKEPLEHAKQSLDFIIVQAQHSIADLFSDIEISLHRAENNINTIKKTDDAKKEIRAISKEKAEYNQRMRSFLNAINPLLKQVISTKNSSKQVILQYVTQAQYNAASVETIISSYQTYAQQFVAAYDAAQIPLNVSDPSNYLVLMVHSVSDFLNDLIRYQIQYIQKKSNKPEYITLASDLAKRLQGTDLETDATVTRLGYRRHMTAFISSYFDQSAPRFEKYFNQGHRASTYAFFSEVLQALMQKDTGLNDDMMHAAELFFNEILYALVSFSSEEQTIFELQTSLNMAALYIKSAQESLHAARLDSDNTTQVHQVIARYNNAVKYYERALPLSGREGSKIDILILTYKALAANLTLALQEYEKAVTFQAGNNITKAVESYAKSSQYFQAGGDQTDATIANVQLNVLRSTQKINEARQYFTTFLQNPTYNISAYLQYISSSPTIPVTNTIKTYEPMLNELTAVYQKALTAYSSAIMYYQEVLAVNIPDIQVAISAELPQLTTALAILHNLIQAQEFMNNGDRQARQKNDLGLVKANQAYEAALMHYQNTDALYSAQPGLSLYIPTHPSLVLTGSPLFEDYTMLANRHAQRLYVELADSLPKNSTNALVYYAAALSKPDGSDSLVSYINNALKTYPSEQALSLLSTVQTEIEELKQASPETWISTTSDTYTSNTDIRWQQILNTISALYRVQPEASYGAYQDTLTAYSSAYAQYVPQAYYPSLYSALLQYRLYMLYNAQQHSQQASALLSTLITNIDQFFTQGAALLTGINDTTLLSSALQSQHVFLQWYKYFKHATIKEDLIAHEFPQEATPLLQEKIDALKDEVTVEFIPGQKTVTFKDPALKLADIYSALAEDSYTNTAYSAAQRYYATAIALYQELNKKNQAERLQQKYTLAYAQAVYHMLIPHGSTPVGGITVPQYYMLNIYSQKVPQQLVNVLSDYTKMDPQALIELKIALAVNIYLYNKLLDINQNYFALMGQLEQGIMPTGLTPAQENAILRAQQEATAFQQELRTKMQQDAQTLELRYEITADGVTYYVDEKNKRIPADNQTPPLYKGYPSAYSYLYTPLVLTAPPLNAANSIKVGTKYFTPGNDLALYARITQSFGHMYIVEGNRYKTQFELLQTCTDQQCAWQKLLQESHNPQAQIGTYVALYNSLNTYFSKMIEYYTKIFTILTPPANTKVLFDIEALPAYQTFLADTYKTFGTTLQNFLIGDPLSLGYYEKIMKIKEVYNKAIQYYAYHATQVDTLQRSLADIFKAAGNKLVASGNHFGSITFFTAAENEYQKILPMPAETQRLLQETFVRKIEVEFQGATINMVAYQKAKSGPLDLTLSNGEREQLSFDQLLEAYMAWITGNKSTPFDVVKGCQYDHFKAIILDAMIFYLNLSKELQERVDTATLEANMDAGLAWLRTFTEKNNVGLDTLPEATAFLAHHDFAAIVTQGFEECKTMLLNADTATQARGYTALSLWANKIFNACSLIYMDDYMGGVDDQAKIEILSHIQAEIEEIASPSKDWVGTPCQTS